MNRKSVERKKRKSVQRKKRKSMQRKKSVQKKSYRFGGDEENFCPSDRDVPYTLRLRDSNTWNFFDVVCTAYATYPSVTIEIGVYKNKEIGGFIQIYEIENTFTYHICGLCTAKNGEFYLPVQDTLVLRSWGLTNENRQSFHDGTMKNSEVINYLIVNALKSTDLVVNPVEDNMIGIMYLNKDLTSILLRAIEMFEYRAEDIEFDEPYTSYTILSKK